MQNWEKALCHFLEKYKGKPYVEGALLCGSYATGNQNKFSDIDVHILLSNTQNWRERGVVSEGKFLIEYFMNPIKKIQEDFLQEYLDGGNAPENMFAYGKILFDKNGCVKQLQDEAMKFLKKTPRKWKKDELKSDLYGVWNSMDELNGLVSENRFINPVYYELTKRLLSVYFKVKGIPDLSFTKTEKILTDPEFARRYHVQKLPDKQFTKLFLDALYNVDMVKIQKLYDFVIKNVGGFDISTFKERSKLES